MTVYIYVAYLWWRFAARIRKFIAFLIERLCVPGHDLTHSAALSCPFL